jgi:YihY family inner membrane protein
MPASKSQPTGIPKVIAVIDAFQQRHPLVAFPFAVIKKFGDDMGGYQAALLTYYGFLSLFPLLLVLVTVMQLWFKNDTALRARVVDSVNGFFPLLGEQLQHSVHSMGKAGVGLAIGILITAYGARGAADALQYMLNNVWQVPRNRRPGFPKNLLQSLTIMASAIVGFAATVAVSSFSAVLGRATWVKLVVNLAGFVVASCVFLFVAHRVTSRRVPLRDMLPGAVFAAAIIQLLLTFGSILIAHQLKGLSSLYGTFAVVLGLLFWIYLIAQVIVYAAEINSVRYLQLWPRGLQGDKPTEADTKAYELYANVPRFTGNKDDTRFKH